ncbi:MAG: TIGR02281 family clan AA aspartic protease, partial [Pseudomonadota bacterium]|nr:TIGR02281 family clan AA aspartic protease [Pseudomonadota bacterium]
MRGTPMQKSWISWASALIILINSPLVWSGSLNIVVVGLFSGKAVLTINEQQRLLEVGNISPEGVKLISATSQSAIIEVEGVQKKYLLGSQVGGLFAPPAKQPMVSIWPNDGMYLTVGSVNGYSVDFLIDTGASVVAFNAATAIRLGLDYLNAPAGMVQTASGVEKAYQVTLDQIQVGDIQLPNLEAMVLDGPQPARAL